MKINHMLLPVLLAASQIVCAQKTLNFGLNRKQDKMPVSRAEIKMPVPVSTVDENSELTTISSFEYIISKGWQLQTLNQQDNSHWYNAVVPGTVLTSLVKQGIYPNPLYGLNNTVIPDTLCRMDWVYRNKINLPKSLRGRHIQLVFNGINYEASIYLNKQYLGNIRGAFTRGIFDISAIVRYGTPNELRVIVHHPHNPGIPQEANSESHGPNGGILCLDGPTFICSEGWDWVPGIRDRNMGIWQDVRLLVSDDVELNDPQITTDLPLPDTSYVNISLKAQLVNVLNQNKQVRIRIEVPKKIDTYMDVNLLPNEKKSIYLTPSSFPALKMHNPRLWWPNGYGRQDMYDMKISIYSSADKKLLYSKTISFGVREMEYILSACDKDNAMIRIKYNPLSASANGKKTFDNINKVKTEDGLYVPRLVNNNGIQPSTEKESAPYIIVKVNGTKIFCKGGNWGMDDAMKRVSIDRMEPYFKLQKEQHFNMIRNWTGESTEELFYELCDKYGILVFNDFWMSTESYNLEPSDQELFLQNVRETVVRYRNHPSIAIWCPRNEGFVPKEYEEGISSIIQIEDGTRYYMPSSILMNTTHSGPWDYREPQSYYRNAKGFDTEIGSPSIPPASTVRKMMAKEDTWPIGDAWYYHDYLMGKWGKQPFIYGYKAAIDTLYGKSDNLDDFCKKAQLVNYESYRAIFEGWNSKMWHNTSGALLWMSHPAWPSMVWQTYSYDYDATGAYYGAKKACKPTHIQMNMDNQQVDLIVAANQRHQHLSVTASLYNIKGEKIKEMSEYIEKPGTNGCMHLFSLPIDEQLKKSEVIFTELKLYENKHLIDDNTYWTSAKGRNFQMLNGIPKANLKVQIRDSHHNGCRHEGKIIITNDSPYVALGIRATIKDILPAFFDDGYFTLMPGQKKTIDYYFTDASTAQNHSVIVEGYNVENISSDSDISERVQNSIMRAE